MSLLHELGRSAIFLSGRTAVEVWALMEVGFWFYFRWKKRSLEERRSYQPAILWKARGERLASLQKMLASVEHIHTGDGFVQKIAARAGNRHHKTSKKSLSLAKHGQSAIQSASSAMGSLFRAPSVEHFLRYMSKRPPPASLQHGLQQDGAVLRSLSQGGTRKSPLRSMSTSPSVENILRCWSFEQQHGSPLVAVASGGEESALRALKHLELCSWFTITDPKVEVCTDISELRRGNIEDWVLSYWFDGADSVHSQELTAEEVEEVHQLTDEVIRWADLPLPYHNQNGGQQQEQDRNSRLRCFRLRHDPFPAVHRPLFVYVSTAFLIPTIGNSVLSWLGFRPYRSGSMEYWFRPPKASTFPKSGRPQRPSANASAETPLLFIHGIGSGPSMCMSFLQRLVRNMGGPHSIFVVDIGAISMRFVDDVPAGNEIASNIANMLEVWGFKQAHFIVHSFGSFVFAWMLRYQRSYIERATCIDPVCFLTLKMFKEMYELQQLRWDSGMNTMEMGIKYFVATELFVCNFCCRCFFWEESQLDMRDLEGVPALVVLEEDDIIVQVHSVRRLVLAEQQRRARKASTVEEAASLELLWLERQPHAGFLADPEANREINACLQKFHSARGPPVD
jgi:pimeloyl-ACP methyl ester carboxylesterase